jgi:hypothetical protein
MFAQIRAEWNTVFAAYGDLVADDLVRGERGAGMRVGGDVAFRVAPLIGMHGISFNRRIIRQEFWR